MLNSPYEVLGGDGAGATIVEVKLSTWKYVINLEVKNTTKSSLVH